MMTDAAVTCCRGESETAVIALAERLGKRSFAQALGWNSRLAPCGIEFMIDYRETGTASEIDELDGLKSEIASLDEKLLAARKVRDHLVNRLVHRARGTDCDYPKTATPSEVAELKALSGDITALAERLTAARNSRGRLVSRLIHKARARSRTRIGNVSRASNHRETA
jgi:hypothetical protein